MLPLLLSLFAAANTVPAQNEPPEIVVTAQRIRDAEANLAACLARKCNPDEDIDATLALAETQLLAGKYRDARSTLLASLGRNKDEATRYPIPVSDLYRANGRVAANLGLDKDYYRSTWGIYRTLKAGLPSDDYRKYSALMEVAEMTYRTRGHSRARLYYDSIARQARADGRPDIAALAELRSAIRHLPPGSSWQRSEINRIASLQGKEMAAPVLEARLALARQAFERDDEAEAQREIDEIAKLGVKRPILVYAPPYAMIQRALQTDSDFGVGLAPPPPVGGEPGSGNESAGGPSVTKVLPTGLFSATNRIAGNFEDMWIDVAFNITPEGRVTDEKIVRSKGNLYWSKPLMLSISGRRYTPGRAGDPGSSRLERYTYTSGYERSTTTRSPLHSPKARVEFIDLSDISAPQ